MPAPRKNNRTAEQEATDKANDPYRKSAQPKGRGSKFSPNEFYRYSGMAIKMAVVIFAGVYGGILLDEKWNLSTPWMTILLSLVGVAMAIYVVIRDTKPR